MVDSRNDTNATTNGSPIYDAEEEEAKETVDLVTSIDDFLRLVQVPSSNSSHASTYDDGKKLGQQLATSSERLVQNHDQYDDRTHQESSDGLDNIGHNVSDIVKPYGGFDIHRDITSRTWEGCNQNRCMNQTGYVHHERNDVYHRSMATSTRHGAEVAATTSPSRKLRKRKHTFPEVLHDILESAEHHGFDDVISWCRNGRSFTVKDRDRFVANVIPLYFLQTRYKSFQRQLTLYGFQSNKAPDLRSYSHECFVQGQPQLLCHIPRTAVKGKRRTGQISATSLPITR